MTVLDKILLIVFICLLVLFFQPIKAEECDNNKSNVTIISLEEAEKIKEKVKKALKKAKADLKNADKKWRGVINSLN